jgi:hypothetical protein
MVHRRGLPGDALGHRDSLFGGLVRQHGSGHDIADGIDPLRGGAALPIDLDESAGIELHTRRLDP